MKKLLIATGNKHKVVEIKEKIIGLDIEILTLNDFPPCEEPIEDAPDFEGNAKIKALYYAKKFGVCTLADDSGLVVDALDGRPGIHSARYAPTNDERISKLLNEMQNVPQSDRSAKFVCVMVLANPNENCLTKVGECKGKITNEAKGTNGFGYDPVFQPEGRDDTLAEISLEEKNKISHRGNALLKIIEALKKEEFKLI